MDGIRKLAALAAVAGTLSLGACAPAFQFSPPQGYGAAPCTMASGSTLGGFSKTAAFGGKVQAMNAMQFRFSLVSLTPAQQQAQWKQLAAGGC